METRMLKVALIDESTRMQEALRALLSTVYGLEVVATAVDAAGARRLLAEHEPDVFVIDVERQDRESAFDLLRNLSDGPGRPDIVVMTAAGSDARRDAFLNAGAQAFFDKAGDGLQLVHWVRTRVAAERLRPRSARRPPGGLSTRLD
jgi:DNA-binding NarL/FixJ family response regulator